MPDDNEGWGFQKHIKGSSCHKPQNGSWLDYWRDKTRLPLPDLCPCNRTEGHAINDNVNDVWGHGITAKAVNIESYFGTNRAFDEGERSAGAHVLVSNGNREVFAIAPCCGSCNNYYVEGESKWFFRAVTILQHEQVRSKFAGMITLPSQYANGNSKWWWQHITAYSVNDGIITIEGYSNRDAAPDNLCDVCTFGDGDACQACQSCRECNFIDHHVCKRCNKRRAIYNNIDGRDYLAQIAQLWRGAQQDRNFGVRGSLARYEEDFQPEILRCNVGMYPGKNKNKYKEAYGLCMNSGCDKDRSSVGGEYCGEECREAVCARQGCHDKRNRTSNYCNGTCEEIAGKQAVGRLCMKERCQKAQETGGEYCGEVCRRAVCARQGCYKSRNDGEYCGMLCKNAVCAKHDCYKDRIGVYCGEACRQAVCKRSGCYKSRNDGEYCSDDCSLAAAVAALDV